MRLTPQHVEIIRQATQQLAGDDARIRLFGSRVNDDARGGDVDLIPPSLQARPSLVSAANACVAQAHKLINASA